MFSFSKDIGIDLGTANTLVCLKGKGIILREPSVVAVDMRTDEVLAVGSQAKEMIGRTPGSIVAVRPLKDGVIADFKITAKMLQHFIKKAVKPGIFSKPRVIICMPSGVTEVERRLLRMPHIRQVQSLPLFLSKNQWLPQSAQVCPLTNRAEVWLLTSAEAQARLP